jgi:manganese oxidase
LSGADDLWLGCWGLIRVLPGPSPLPDTPFQLPVPKDIAWPSATVLAMPAAERRFRVRAERQPVTYRSDIVDPFGLVYRLTAVKEPGGSWKSAGPAQGNVKEPLVLWCRENETVVVELTNGIVLAPGETLEPEPNAPEVPVELDQADRPVSSQVSMHADLVRYNVRTSDGANVGLNPVQTIPPGVKREYRWDTSRPVGAPEPLGPVLLQDMADFRNHRHHGLIGALVILPEDATPFEVKHGETTARPTAKRAWHGARVTVVGGKGAREEHMVLLMQDGLRLFMKGAGTNFGFPLPDPPDEPAGEGEKEDQGQKGFNYRSEPISPIFDPQGNPYTHLRPDPATPIVHVPEGAEVRLHLVGACDKPRHHSFTVHGVAWEETRFVPPGQSVPWVSSESAVSCGTVRTFAFTAPEYTDSHDRDYAYRSGMLRWDVPQGMWGIMRVE